MVGSVPPTKQTLRSHARCMTADEVIVIAGLHDKILVVLVVHIRRLCAALWLHCLRQTRKVKFVGVPLSVHLGHDILVVVIP